VHSIDSDTLPDYLLTTYSDVGDIDLQIHPLLSTDGIPAPGTDPSLLGRAWGLSVATESAHGLHALSGEFDGNAGMDIFAIVYLADEWGVTSGSDTYMVPGWGMDWNNLP
jgi:hypothetical protein